MTRNNYFPTLGFLPLLLIFLPLARGTSPSPLFSRGYAVLPEPQQVELRSGDFLFGADWTLHGGDGVRSGSGAIESLTEQLESRYHLSLANTGSKQLILQIRKGSIQPGSAQDKDHEAIANQAYRIELSPSRVNLVANTETGLFYAVQTFVQLLNSPAAQLRLPQGTIVDWPDLQLRQIYWDDAHHLEHLSDLKAAVRQAAFFKINGFVIKLEGHFQYRSAPSLVEPQALSPAEFQELTDYGLHLHVQVIPYLDAPAHIAFILKHPEYKPLRAFPESNYELCATNPDSLKLMYGMYDDLLAANKGVKYFYLSTDEAYYIGWAENAQCNEVARAKELGSRGKLLAQFVTSASNYLHDRGRTVIIWGEYPLKPEDINSLPPHIVNGETYGENFDPLYKKRGIRQTIYGSTEGEERMFPQYSLGPATGRLHALHETEKRVPDSIAKIVAEPARKTSDLFGLFIAGWGDMGLHPETFWLGYATITATGWKPVDGHAQEWTSAFFPAFYGTGAFSMERVYQLMSLQAQTWTDTWDTRNSTSRKPIWGNSEKIFSPAVPAHDQALALPPVPQADLTRSSTWKDSNARRFQISGEALQQNEELIGLLNANLLRVTQNRYGLEVFLAIANLCRQNLEMLGELQEIDTDLAAATLSAATDPKKALTSLDKALTAVRQIRADRNRAYQDATETWMKSWLPRVAQANGRHFLHEVDDVKDHLPDRTIDMSYLILRELQLPLDDWYGQTQAARNTYAKKHGMLEQDIPLNWSELQ